MTPALATSSSTIPPVPAACSATGACSHATSRPALPQPSLGSLLRVSDAHPGDAAAPSGQALGQALGRLAGFPGVPEAVDGAREACAALRWHPALRRRAAEARAESGVRAVRASAALAGARVPVSLVRDVARGAAAFPSDA